MANGVGVVVASPAAACWRAVPLLRGTDLESVAARAHATLSISDCSHDVEWMSVEHGWPDEKMLVLSDEDDDELMGLAVFRISTAPLEYALGPVVFLRWRTKQFCLYQELISRRSDRSEAIGSCFEELGSALPHGSVVYVGAVPVGSETHRELEDRSSPVRRHFSVFPWGRPMPRCGIAWKRSVEAYLTSISRRTARDLRRRATALFSNQELTCEVRRFKSQSDVDIFLRDAESISDKTYQKKDLGLGLSRGGPRERTIRFAAERDGFLGYVLYINGQPAAFDYCFIYGETCTMKNKGYDPAWAAYHLGSVLHLEILCDFERNNVPVSYIDYSSHFNHFKFRTTNDHPLTQNYYLFPRTITGAIQYFMLKSTDSLSRSIASLVGRLPIQDAPAGCKKDSQRESIPSEPGIEASEGAAREPRSHADERRAPIHHHRASRTPPSADNRDSRRAGRTNAGCAASSSHGKVARSDRSRS